MLNTLFVVDDDVVMDGSHLPVADLKSISFDTYLQEYPKLNEPKTRVINLCDTSRYLSQGYYCSLLAEARSHQVFPSVRVINALRDGGVTQWLDGRFGPDKKAEPAGWPESLLVCMGETSVQGWEKLANEVFQLFPAPLLRVVIKPAEVGNGLVVQVTRVSWVSLSEQDHSACADVLVTWSHKFWKRQEGGKKYRWDLAMLVPENDPVPPSDRGALNRFVKAGDKLGIRVHKLTVSELVNLANYDALFIRETTAIDHHTYRLAREAEQLGLVVIDDPDSILRCCNKVFLHDAFHYQKVPSLKTRFVRNRDEVTLDSLELEFGYPMVLKMPEGSFSRGVFRVKDRAELDEGLKGLLSESALVLAQEYLFTEYDWRIGVLNGRALYACRYHMARNHWQIYNHSSKKNFSGGFDTLPTFEAPQYVLTAALKAAAVIGNGLYGIDIKEVDGKACVLEVNDNPSIDHGVEDKYLGDELYMQVMSEFLRRLEARGR